MIVSQSFDICHRPNSILSNLDVGLATIAKCEEYFFPSRVLHSVILQSPMCFGEDLSSLKFRYISSQYLIISHYVEVPHDDRKVHHMHHQLLLILD